MDELRYSPHDPERSPQDRDRRNEPAERTQPTSHPLGDEDVEIAFAPASDPTQSPLADPYETPGGASETRCQRVRYWPHDRDGGSAFDDVKADEFQPVREHVKRILAEGEAAARQLSVVASETVVPVEHSSGQTGVVAAGVGRLAHVAATWGVGEARAWVAASKAAYRSLRDTTRARTSR